MFQSASLHNIPTCEPFSVISCTTGFGFVQGTPTSDRKCQLCSSGHYQDQHGTDMACTPHSITSCGPNQRFVPGRTSTDSRCLPCENGLVILEATHQLTTCYCPSYLRCTRCKLGEAMLGTNPLDETCTPCLQGTYGTYMAVFDCLNCPGETYMPYSDHQET